MNKQIYAYVGKWGKNPPEGGFGFALCRYDGETGGLIPFDTTLTDIHVGSACIDTKNNVLYCVDEVRGLPGLPADTGGGRVFAAKLDPETGSMVELNNRPTFAPQPSYVAYDATREYLVVTNHSVTASVTQAKRDAFGHYHLVIQENDASVVLYHLNADGSVGEACDVVKLTGHGPGPRQESPHPHSVVMSPDGRFFAVCDKGTDRVHLYTIDRIDHRLVDTMGNGKLSFPGSKPRYSVFHPELPVLYFNNEGLEAVCTARYEESGLITSIEQIPTLPTDHEGKKGEASDIRLHPNGKTLYNISRGANYVTVYAVGEDGGLTAVQYLHFEATPFGGGGARGCAFSPDGRWLYLAVTDDGQVHKLAVAEDGTLNETEPPIAVLAAANVIFFER